MLRRGVMAMLITKTDNNGMMQAAEIIKSGGLVALPTETVYGLAADAFNADAVARIYTVKGRPSDNPLILHIADKEKLLELAEALPPYAHALTEKFWPGPLTLVVRKKAGLPAWLGGCPPAQIDTAGVRMPAHPAMLELIRVAGCIIAAPSANLAGRPSPTRAEHVLYDYKDAENAPDLLLDGGAAEVGVESTVVDVTGDSPVVLRHGAVTKEMIASALSNVAVHHLTSQEADTPRAPGMKYRHYAPIAPMTLLRGGSEEIAAYIATQIISEMDASIGVLVSPRTRACLDAKWPKMAVQSDASYAPLVSFLDLGDPGNPAEIARNLYASLRKFDELGVDIILAEAPPDDGMGAALTDRMTKAAEGRVIHLGAVRE